MGLSGIFHHTLVILCSIILLSSGQVKSEPMKNSSVFFPPQYSKLLQKNIQNNPWVNEFKNKCVEAAGPWMPLSDDELWNAGFGPDISRSWMVWSDGWCPACHEPVKMYAWIIDPFQHPWKVECPHCKEFFPKNDFYSYYTSGMNEHGIFDPSLADRSLLFNEEHPTPSDSLYKFGVDDGEGFVMGGKRWRFIGAYLIYGQWKKLIVQGVYNLAQAYAVTGDRQYAHKAAILLDRIADLYPDFSFGTQGFSYEKQDSLKQAGYVSVWHDACMETRALALAYDQIFDAIKDDAELVAFLSQKAKTYKLDNPKTSFELVQKNIETRLFKDVINHRYKIESNFPQTDLTLVTLTTIMEWPQNKDQVMQVLDNMFNKVSAVDGVSGEKGLAGYATIAPRTIAGALSIFSRLDSTLLETLLKRHPNLYKTFRFHVDTWVNEEYYPRVGDTGRFGQKTETYMGAAFNKISVNNFRDFYFTSDFTLFKKLYEITKDPVYMQLIYKANNFSVKGLPYDVFATDTTAFQQAVTKAVMKYGTKVNTKSINMQEWCLAILKSGIGDDTRAVWLDYDNGGNHCHADAMNIGLIAKGLDIMPGFGYPPVQFGGWHTPEAKWYRKTASHNTVVVDQKDQMIDIGGDETDPMSVLLNPLKRHRAGKSTLWAIGKTAQAVRATGKNISEEENTQQYERTVMLVDISDKDSYVFDTFRVVGGTDHAKFVHGFLGELETPRLKLQPCEIYNEQTLMKDFKIDPTPPAAWQATWKFDDYYHYLKNDADIRLQYTDLTHNASASTANTWIAFGFDGKEDWIKSLMIRRKSSSQPLSSCFVSVMEPLNTVSNIKTISRLPIGTKKNKLYNDMNVAVKIELKNNLTDYIIAMDVENPKHELPDFNQQNYVFLKELGLETDAELCWLRKDEKGLKSLLIANGSFLKADDFNIDLKEKQEIFELEIRP